MEINHLLVTSACPVASAYSLDRVNLMKHSAIALHKLDDAWFDWSLDKAANMDWLDLFKDAVDAADMGMDLKTYLSTLERTFLRITDFPQTLATLDFDLNPLTGNKMILCQQWAEKAPSFAHAAPVWAYNAYGDSYDDNVDKLTGKNPGLYQSNSGEHILGLDCSTAWETYNKVRVAFDLSKYEIGE